MSDETDIVYRLHKRAEIRRQISTRKSVQEGKADRLADLLDEAANEIASLRQDRATLFKNVNDLLGEREVLFNKAAGLTEEK
jgi:hypothetical protein